jgi:hypothetical protein
MRFFEFMHKTIRKIFPKPDRNQFKNLVFKDMRDTFDTEVNPKPRKLNKKYGCQICEYIYVSRKNTCGHKFCEDCIATIIVPNDALDNCIKCEEFISNQNQIH